VFYIYIYVHIYMCFIYIYVAMHALALMQQDIDVMKHTTEVASCLSVRQIDLNQVQLAPCFSIKQVTCCRHVSLQLTEYIRTGIDRNDSRALQQTRWCQNIDIPITSHAQH
jgi:hypothetical protein